MAFKDFLGTREVKDCDTEHETSGHQVTIEGTADKVIVACAGHPYPSMTYHPKGPDGPERLEGRYPDGHLLTITRREDGKGIGCTLTKDSVDTGSWTADDHGAGNGAD